MKNLKIDQDSMSKSREYQDGSRSLIRASQNSLFFPK